MFSEESLATTLNKIKDNLWIGDTEAARSSARDMLGRELETKTIREYRAAFAEFRDQYVELRETFKREYTGSELDYVLSKKFAEMVIEKKADPKDAIIGSILEYVASLDERLTNVKLPLEIVFAEKFKYSILNLGNRYEIRMLFLNGLLPNINEMLEKLKAEGFSVNLSIDSESYSLISAFSNEAYIEIIVFVPRAEFSIILQHSPQEKVEKLSKILVHSLASGS